MSGVVLSFVAGEILKSGTNLEIRTANPVDVKSARSAIILRQNGKNLAAPLIIDEKGGPVRINTKGLDPGDFELHLHELFDIKGRELVNHRITPFRIGGLIGKIPKELRVEHVTYVALGEVGVRRLAPGEKAPAEFKYIEFAKGVHREKGTPVDLAFDGEGKEVNGPSLLADVQRRRFAKFGRLHPALFNRLSRAKDSDLLNVVVWPEFKVDLSGYEKPNQCEIKEPLPAASDLLKVAIRSRSAVHDALVKLGAKIQDISTGTPVIHASLRASQVHSLAKFDGIGKVYLDNRSGVDDLADSEAIARATQAHALGFTGSGVHVAVFEPYPDDTTNLVFAGKHLSSPPTSDHARLTNAIIKNVEPGKSHGYAPDCQLYSASSYDNASLHWAVKSPQLCTVVSQSFHRTLDDGPDQNEEFSGLLSADDHLKDLMALQYPYPTIVHAAGNGEDSEFVNHKGFNTISVGSHDDNATAMAGDTIHKNPSSAHGDRELPEIAANGMGVTAVGLTKWGTSFAAPAVAGTVALLQSVNSTLKSWPEGCRAILFASADRTTVSGGTWVDDLGKRINQSDGAGCLNSQMGVLIAQQRKYRDAPTAPRGWDVGSLATGDFGADRLATFRYRVHVPPPSLIIRLPFVYTVKIALAWNGKISSDAAGVQTSALTVDLDLIVRDSAGNQVASSASYDNSYEIVEFKGIAGAAYEIIIRRWSGTDTTWFGIAWNVTSRVFFNPPLIPGLDS